MLNHHILDLIYLIASVTFVIGLKMLSHPSTARKGNLIAAGGMFIAIAGTIALHEGEVAPIIYILIASAILIGATSGLCPRLCSHGQGCFSQELEELVHGDSLS